MKFPSSPFQLAILSILSVVTVSWATSDPLVNIDDFLQCLSKQSQSTSSIHAAIYTPQNTSFQSVLSDRIKNRRFSTSTTPKPLAIVAAKHKYHVQATVLCAKQQGLQIRIRSGGHDYEGLSYVSHVPFIILDMFQLQSINVNVAEETAWVQSGATLGQVYYKIAEKSNVLGFPAGVGPTVGAGGHFSGGGYGSLMRKYGLSIDNIIDAKIVVADGRVLDRKSMGEDLFWAIRGGGGASFGVILSWKLKLVSVPAKVTVFNVSITLEQGATDVVYKWQYVAPLLPKDLFLRVRPLQVNSTTGRKKTVKVSFIGLFLGRTNKLLPLVKERFPELGLQRRDCFEMSWIENKVFFADFPIGTPITILLNRTNGQPSFFKAKSDYVTKPIPKRFIESLWKEMIKIDNFWMDWNPYGGRMGEIPESATPYPHRAGNLFLIQYYAVWVEEGVEAASKYLQLSRKLFDLMTPYVSKNPREAFQNYRDLEIGANLDNQTNFQIAKIYGSKYFKGNFDRLVRVKTMVDPHNFFKHEQSIPPV